MLRQRQNILSPLGERRHPKDPAGDAIIQIAAEFAARARLLQVLIGRADQAELGVVPGVAADALVRAFLYYPQQLDLQRHRQLSHLVEKQRPAMGQRKRTVARPDCAGKRATLMAEELAARQFGDDRRAVEDDELVRRGARIELVDKPRDQLLAGSALADEKNRSRGESCWASASL